MQNKIITVIKDVADYHLDDFVRLGHAPAGCNGPYNEIDTPMRNTANWCCTYSYLYLKYGEEQYKIVLEKFRDFLLDEYNYGISGAAICRDNPVDKTNGLVGQAWVIEGIVSLYKVFKTGDILDKAISIYKSQQFNSDKGLWVTIDADGSSSNDIAFNHHIWFAAAGMMISSCRHDEKIEYEINRFLDKASDNCIVHPNGILYHYCNPRKGNMAEIKHRIRPWATLLKVNSRYSRFYTLEKGYHLFDLYGFALLSLCYGNHNFFKTKKFDKALRKLSDLKFLTSLSSASAINEYAFPYNSPAFEYPFISKAFHCYNEDIANKLWEIQMDLFYNVGQKMFSKKTNDKLTLTARMYEYLRSVGI